MSKAYNIVSQNLWTHMLS